MPVRSFWVGAVSFLLCALGSVLVGLLVYGQAIFDTGLVYFQFVAAGILCGSFVVSAKIAGPKSVILVGMAAYGVVLAYNGSSTGIRFFRDAVWVSGLALAVVLGLWNSRFLPRLIIGKFVVWSATFGIVHLCMFTLLSFVNGGSFDQSMALTATRLGALIGAGVGLGHELGELVNQRWSDKS